MNYENEVWKPVPGYEGHYEVSDMGRVRSLKRGKITILKLETTKDGYNRIHFSMNGVVKKYNIHRLVYTVHDSPIEEDLVIDHKNTVRNDNRLTNLRAVTQHQNVIYTAENKHSSGKATSIYIGVCKHVVRGIPYFDSKYKGKTLASFRCEAIAGFVAKMIYDGIIPPESLKCKHIPINKNAKPACQKQI